VSMSSGRKERSSSTIIVDDSVQLSCYGFKKNTMKKKEHIHS
jgi:hypothetical protein